VVDFRFVAFGCRLIVLLCIFFVAFLHYTLFAFCICSLRFTAFVVLRLPFLRSVVRCALRSVTCVRHLCIVVWMLLPLRLPFLDALLFSRCLVDCRTFCWSVPLRCFYVLLFHTVALLLRSFLLCDCGWYRGLRCVARPAVVVRCLIRLFIPFHLLRSLPLLFVCYHCTGLLP